MIDEYRAMDWCNDRIEQLTAERDQLEFELASQTYHGNTIGYIYDKMLAYRNQVGELASERDRLQETLKRIMKENSDYIDGIDSENDLLLEGFRLIQRTAQGIYENADNSNFVRTEANNMLSWIRNNIQEPVLDELVKESQERGEYG